MQERHHIWKKKIQKPNEIWVTRVEINYSYWNLQHPHITISPHNHKRASNKVTDPLYLQARETWIRKIKCSPSITVIVLNACLSTGVITTWQTVYLLAGLCVPRPPPTRTEASIQQAAYFVHCYTAVLSTVLGNIDGIQKIVTELMYGYMSRLQTNLRDNREQSPFYGLYS